MIAHFGLNNVQFIIVQFYIVQFNVAQFNIVQFSYDDKEVVRVKVICLIVAGRISTYLFSSDPPPQPLHLYGSPKRGSNNFLF